MILLAIEREREREREYKTRELLESGRIATVDAPPFPLTVSKEIPPQ